jgi:metallo-beta-lactamase family protein
MPLYTQEEAEIALEQLRPVDFGTRYTLDGSLLGFTMYRMGHILGAAAIRLDDGITSILFSGDIGRMHSPVMKAPAKIQGADYLLVESTYGDRLHTTDDPTDEIGEIIRRTAGRGGSVIIPSFAVGRAQALMYHIYVLKQKRLIPDLPVFLDSPMAIKATELLQRHPADHRLNEQVCKGVSEVARYTTSTDDSKAINGNNNNMPKVIISASGMATGGRILHHMKHYIGDERNTIIFAGFQAEGTRGDILVRGEKEVVIHGQTGPVRAEIVQLHSMSAHADYAEIMQWLGYFTQQPRRTFIVHGEAHAALAMKNRIEEEKDWDVHIPAYAEMVEL